MVKKTKPSGVAVETSLEYRGRPLIVELHPKYMTVRAKGLHEAFVAPYDAIYEMAMKVRARGGQ